MESAAALGTRPWAGSAAFAGAVGGVGWDKWHCGAGPGASASALGEGRTSAADTVMPCWGSAQAVGDADVVLGSSPSAAMEASMVFSSPDAGRSGRRTKPRCSALTAVVKGSTLSGGHSCRGKIYFFKQMT